MGDFTIEDAIEDLEAFVSTLWAINNEPTWDIVKQVHAEAVRLMKKVEEA
jgi:hypothetical protein